MEQTLSRTNTGRTALVIEDAPEFSRLAEATLRAAGYDVTVASSGECGLARARAIDPDVVLVDVELPGTDGYQVVRALRDFTDAYVVMVTGRSGGVEVSTGLDLGADDHMSKPYAPRELVARLDALHRRPRKGIAERRGAGLLIDATARTAHLGEHRVDLTPVELALLLLLTARPGRVVSRNELMLELWGSTTYVSAHSLDVHVANLRRKIAVHRPTGTAQGRSPITTVRGVGFRYDPEHPSDPIVENGCADAAESR